MKLPLLLTPQYPPSETSKIYNSLSRQLLFRNKNVVPAFKNSKPKTSCSNTAFGDSGLNWTYGDLSVSEV